MRPLRHPSPDEITLHGILHALADPTRLAIVAALKEQERCVPPDGGDGINCVETMERVKQSLPKSTCSQHFLILREAGLIRSERRGVELFSRLRCRELNERFPGLLQSILSAHAASAPVEAAPVKE
ncbi:ArsR family transcriptional regulator [Verrucomicrobia bacterium LW23]|nr:ArsR family transcriptional regulator [Verrucomicrobia bacterium LW23]